MSVQVHKCINVGCNRAAHPKTERQARSWLCNSCKGLKEPFHFKCPICGVEFETDNPQKRYCSKSCLWASQRSPERLKAARERYRGKSKPSKPCSVCGLGIPFIGTYRRSVCEACRKRIIYDYTHSTCVYCGREAGGLRYCSNLCRVKIFYLVKER